MCDLCLTDTVYKIPNGTVAAATLSSGDYSTFNEKLAGLGIFGDSFPTLAVGVGAGRDFNTPTSHFICARPAASSATFEPASLLGPSTSSICLTCLGGIPNITITNVLVAVNSSVMVYKNMQASVGDIYIFSELSITGISATFTYSILNTPAWTGVFGGALKLKKLGGNGPSVSATLAGMKTSITADFSGVNWGLFALLDALGVASQISIPDAGLNNWLHTAGVLSEASLVICDCTWIWASASMFAVY